MKSNLAFFASAFLVIFGFVVLLDELSRNIKGVDYENVALSTTIVSIGLTYFQAKIRKWIRNKRAD
jgi:divalent metal cation (Fe/Co/Zn/Cd) transporter